MIYETIEKLISYAKCHLGLNSDDEMYMRNSILHELELDSFPSNVIEINEKEIAGLKVPDLLIEELHAYFINELKLSDKETELKETKIMGILSPLPSEVNRKFYELRKEDDFKALSYLYDLSIKNNYVAKTRIDKNLFWKADFGDKYLEITVNLSKPEKNTKDIAKLLIKSKSDVEKYPKCLLCGENVGYYGRLDHPARSNIRVINLNLDGEKWFLQYSPYGYFNMHCIVVDSIHENMIIDEGTFKKFFDFIDLFPSFFIGSNADLPIVGGSILNHEHFQGGEHLLPVMNAKTKESFKSNKFKNTCISLLDWFNSTILLQGKDRNELISCATNILSIWRDYSDIDNDIIANENGVEHNTITPGLKKEKDGTYNLYLILRNNRCNAEFEDGIFHAHKEFYHIKKENIGIIEAMGQFILPARLITQNNEIKESLKNKLGNEEIIAKYPNLAGFEPMFDALRVNYNESTIDEDIKNYINNVCKNILENTAVFKNDDKGQKGFIKFIKASI
jgi:UDPglucose--hexose-1-phosphate uridylyltransferase